MLGEKSNFKHRVELVVAAIPSSKVMTYGQIAALCGQPKAARIVGGIAHFGNPDLPWHRVVNRKGGLASGYPGGRPSQALHLEAEGIKVSGDHYVDLGQCLFCPPLSKGGS